MHKPMVYIGLVNPKSPDNVAAVMRSSGNFQVDKVFYTQDRYPRALKRQSGSVNMKRKVGQNIPLSQSANLMNETIQAMKIVCIELVENAMALPEYQHPENAFYIFGPEDNSLSQEMINQADSVVYIPTIGCMNLAASVSVLLYDRAAKLKQYTDGKELIQQSRDTNNRLKVY